MGKFFESFQVKARLDYLSGGINIWSYYILVHELEALRKFRNCLDRSLEISVELDYKKAHKLVEETINSLDKRARKIYRYEYDACRWNIIFRKFKAILKLYLWAESAKMKFAREVRLHITTDNAKSMEIIVNKFKEQFAPYERQPTEKRFIATVKWFVYDMHGNLKTIKFEQQVYIDSEKELNLKYPSVKKQVGDVATFIRNFINSTAPILVLYGEKGVGKSWFAHHVNRFLDKYNPILLVRNGKVLESLEFWEEAVPNKVILLDDLDEVLIKRQDGGYRLTGDILSLSGGIARLPAKLIITTNVMCNIDEAFLRPGRTYAVIKIEPHTIAEAKELLEYWGEKEKITYLNKKSEWTLAELYALRRDELLGLHKFDFGNAIKGFGE